jgi:hypothetical protein
MSKRLTSETTILDIIKSVLPDGTTVKSAGWDSVCDWPPDLFAVAATITERSGLYADPIFSAYWAPEFALAAEWIADVVEAGRAWAQIGIPPGSVQALWDELIHKHRNAGIGGNSHHAAAWKKIVFQLLAIADEASAGIGFMPSLADSARTLTGVQYLYYSAYVTWEEKREQERDPEAVGGGFLPWLPHSLCVRVPLQVACVQPKASTPGVGCTLRSLTHYLALLPPRENVTTHWHIAQNKLDDETGPFNVMLVPFPYLIPGKSFKGLPGRSDALAPDHAFMLDPAVWTSETNPEDFAKFLCGLIDSAKQELEPVHAMVLPETALKLEFANEVAGFLAKESGLQLFLSGVVADANGASRNLAAMYRFGDRKVLLSSFQSKHHRWRLDGAQIRRYNLGHVLDPHETWWEKINISYRNCYLWQFRAGAALSVLICEDLARYDPVLFVLNAIGPNLVIALLLDGPQLEHRWPGRYATVLADDPGSSVLTLTSFGMVARSTMPGEMRNREIALWKEPNGKAVSLKLPRGDHALLLSLTQRTVEQFTLDRRGDGGATVQFALGAAHGIRHAAPPVWLKVAD